jgi:hypothetical protein
MIPEGEWRKCRCGIEVLQLYLKSGGASPIAIVDHEKNVKPPCLGRHVTGAFGDCVLDEVTQC